MGKIQGSLKVLARKAEEKKGEMKYPVSRFKRWRELAAETPRTARETEVKMRKGLSQRIGKRPFAFSGVLAAIFAATGFFMARKKSR